MTCKHSLPLLSTLTVALVATAVTVVGGASALSAASHHSLVIRHQTRGCHSWAVDRGVYRASQSVTLSRGGTITFVDNDVMSHKLIKTSGPALRLPATMSHVGATVKITFTRAGTYRFVTKAGEDYMQGIKTTGEDNVLRLTVKVA
jgi:plastocyanin